MDAELLNAIKTFTEKQAGRDANNITENTSLEKYPDGERQVPFFVN